MWKLEENTSKSIWKNGQVPKFYNVYFVIISCYCLVLKINSTSSFEIRTIFSNQIFNFPQDLPFCWQSFHFACKLSVLFFSSFLTHCQCYHSCLPEVHLQIRQCSQVAPHCGLLTPILSSFHLLTILIFGTLASLGEPWGVFEKDHLYPKWSRCEKKCFNYIGVLLWIWIMYLFSVGKYYGVLFGVLYESGLRAYLLIWFWI